MINKFDVYAINLKKDNEKRAHIESNILKTGFNYYIYDAVYGAELNEDCLADIYSEKDAIAYRNRPLSKGEIGCFLSHAGIWQSFLSSEKEIAVIVEDDVDFMDGFSDVVFEILKLDNESWDIVLLGGHSKSSRNNQVVTSLWGRVFFKNFSLRKPVEKVMGSYGYVINKKSVIKIIEDTKHIFKPVDHHTGDYKSFKLYCVSPPVVKNNDFYSKEMHSMQDRDFLKKNMPKANDPVLLKLRNRFFKLRFVVFLKSIL